MAYRTHEPHLVPVLSAVRPNPELQDTHMLAPMAGQAAPRTGTPFGQVHTFHTVPANAHVCGLVMRHDSSQKFKMTVYACSSHVASKIGKQKKQIK